MKLKYIIVALLFICFNLKAQIGGESEVCEGATETYKFSGTIPAINCYLTWNVTGGTFEGGGETKSAFANEEVKVIWGNSLSGKIYFASASNCGNGTLDVTITNTSINVSNNVTINQGESTTLKATPATFDSYEWTCNTPNCYLSSTTGATVIASPQSTTTYYVKSKRGSCTSSQKSVTVTVNGTTTPPVDPEDPSSCTNTTKLPASSLSFDGVDDVVQVPLANSIDKIWSIEFWYHSKGLNVFKNNDVLLELPGGLFLILEVTGVLTLWDNNSLRPILAITGGRGDNKKHHVAIVRNNDAFSLIHDGVAKSAKYDLGGQSGTICRLSNSAAPYKGLIWNFKIWNSVKTESEICQNMNTDYNPTSELKGYWSLGEMCNGQIFDKSGNGNHISVGVSSSTPTIADPIITLNSLNFTRNTSLNAFSSLTITGDITVTSGSIAKLSSNGLVKVLPGSSIKPGVILAIAKCPSSPNHRIMEDEKVANEDQVFNTNLIAIPNPSNLTTVIKYKLNHQGKVLIAITDESGRPISTVLKVENHKEGLYEISFDTSKLRPGVYLYSLETNTTKEVKRLIIQH